jgi:hypothetical protein
LNPRGSFRLDSYHRVHTYTGTDPATGLPIDVVQVDDQDTNMVQGTDDEWTIQMSITTTEPFLGLSPLIFGDPKFNNAGMIGVNSMNFMCNIDTQASRLFSMVKYGDSDINIKLGHTAISGISGMDTDRPAFANTSILAQFLTLQETDAVEAKNSVPYMDFPRFLTTKLPQTIPADPNTFSLANTKQATSQSIQLNQIPDYFIIVLRKPMNEQKIYDSSTFMGISGIQVSLNNNQGLLSNAQQVDLWRMSVKNGSSQSFEEFSGVAYADTKVVYTADAVTGDLSPQEVVPSMPATVFTTGSLLVINPALDLSLPSYLSNGSTGQYNFQVTVNYYNNSMDSFSPELVIITANSGQFVTQSGSSMIQSGLLTKDIVVSTNASQSNDPVTHNSYARTVGGSYLDSILTNVKKIPLFKRHHHKSGSGIDSAGGLSKAIKNANLNKFT